MSKRRGAPATTAAPARTRAVRARGVAPTRRVAGRGRRRIIRQTVTRAARRVPDRILGAATDADASVVSRDDEHGRAGADIDRPVEAGASERVGGKGRIRDAERLSSGDDADEAHGSRVVCN